MKQTKLFVLIILIVYTNLTFNIFGQEYNILQVCKQDSILRTINIPLIEIWTNDGIEPTGTNITAPDGLWGTGLINNEYVYGRMRLSLKDSLIYDSNNNGIKIRLRGNSSSIWEKRPYKLKLSKSTDLLFRDKSYNDKDWVLKSVYDGFITKVYTGLNIGLQVGLEWEPECKIVNLVINGKYRGDYILTETIEREICRLNIDNSGYLIEDDAYWWNENKYFKTNILPNQVGYTFKYPDPDELNDSIINNIKKYIINFEETLSVNGDISQYIEIGNWAAWLLAQDILGQSDAGGTNRFLYKEDYNPSQPNSTLLKMGPLWDFDATFGVSDKWSNIHRIEYSFYFIKLLQREDFYTSYVYLWESLKDNILNKVTNYLYSTFDNYKEDINKSRILNKEIYPYDDKFTPIEEEIESTLIWIDNRINWISEQLKNETSVNVLSKDITKETCIYNIYGQKLPSKQNLPNGIYIIDGKKVLIK
ncbi:MAG: CotH kinase family protein [Bacteroidaceae bacterium]|nr:CotH kinase family protein [Bacteroidaceae bacterium]